MTKSPRHRVSFDLQQYFLRTADNDVERYLKLFTFLSLDEISLLMGEQRQNESKRLAQHVLAKEIVELAHGAQEAKTAETAHKEIFSHGSNTFSLGALRSYMNTTKNPQSLATSSTKRDKAIFAYKQTFAAQATAQALPETTNTQSQDGKDNKVTLPVTMLQAGSFPRVLHAAGLASSKSDAHRLIAKRGAYVLVPNSGSTENPTALEWTNIEADAIATADPSHFLVDFDVLVLRSGKSNMQICRVVTEEQFEAEGLTCPGWEALKAQRMEANK
jgi:tyrosyl-tRNA synthetase